MRRKRVRSFDLLSKYDGYTPGWKGVGALLLFAIGGQFLGALVSLILYPFIPQEYATAIAYPIMFLPAMYWCSAQSLRTLMFDESGTVPMDRNSMKPLQALITAITAALATICCAVAIEPLVKILPEMPDSLKAAMETLTEGPIWISLLTTAVFAPFFEEWLCRGMVLRGLLKHTSPAIAICASSLFFAIIHLNPWQALPAFILGCLMGYVYYKTGSLKLTMLMHCANNAFSVISVNMPAFRNYESFGDVFTNKFVYAAVICACVAVTMSFISYIKRTNSAE